MLVGAPVARAALTVSVWGLDPDGCGCSSCTACRSHAANRDLREPGRRRRRTGTSPLQVLGHDPELRRAARVRRPLRQRGTTGLCRPAMAVGTGGASRCRPDPAAGGAAEGCSFRPTAGARSHHRGDQSLSKPAAIGRVLFSEGCLDPTAGAGPPRALRADKHRPHDRGRHQPRSRPTHPGATSHPENQQTPDNRDSARSPRQPGAGAAPNPAYGNHRPEEDSHEDALCSRRGASIRTGSRLTPVAPESGVVRLA